MVGATEKIQDEKRRLKERKILGGRKGRGPTSMSILDISAHFKTLGTTHSNGDPVLQRVTTTKRKFEEQILMTESPDKEPRQKSFFFKFSIIYFIHLSYLH